MYGPIGVWVWTILNALLTHRNDQFTPYWDEFWKGLGQDDGYYPISIFVF
jgi:hypothetical protein